MFRVELKSNQFKSLVETLKKSNKLGSTIISRNDLFYITNRNPHMIGRHFSINPIDDVGNSIFIMRDIKKVIDELDVKGRKISIFYERLVDKISLFINDTSIVLFELLDLDSIDSELLYRPFIDQDWSSLKFTSNQYRSISLENLQIIKDNGLVKLQDDDNIVRVAKSNFPEIGTSRSINFTIDYRMECSDELGIIIMIVSFTNSRIIHILGFARYSVN